MHFYGSMSSWLEQEYKSETSLESKGYARWYAADKVMYNITSWLFDATTPKTMENKSNK